MFVTESSFAVEPYSIPDLDSPDKSGEEFARFVARYEEDILILLMGEVQYDAFISGLEELPDAWDSTTAYILGTQVYKGLSIWEAVQDNTGVSPVEGVDWTLVEETNKWLALRDGNDYDTSRKWKGLEAMLTPFIYSEWLDTHTDTFTGNTVAAPVSENSTKVADKRRRVNSWNDFATLAGSGCSRRNSLYGFCKTNSEDYPDFDFTDPGRMNIFNL